MLNAHPPLSSFEDDYVQTQLKYTGVLETIRIRKEGFAIRLKFPQFLQQYGVIAFPGDPRDIPYTPENLNKVCKEAGVTGHLLGKTRIFLKPAMREKLTTKRRKVIDDVNMCQNAIRAWAARRRAKKLREQAKREAAEVTAFIAALETPAVDAASTLGKGKAIIEERLAALTRAEEEKLKAEEEARQKALKEVRVHGR